MGAAVVDPDFGGDGLQGKADPEGGAEEFFGLGRVAAQQRGGEEGSHDGADGSDGESDGVAANHPLAMPGELAAQRVPERFRKANQEESSEEDDGGLFVEAADGFSKRQFQASDSHDGASGEKNASRPAVHLRIARAQAAHKLQRPQHHEKHCREDVRQHQSAFACEMRVQFCGRIFRGAQSAGLQQNDSAPGSDREPDEGEKNHCGPKESPEGAIWTRHL